MKKISFIIFILSLSTCYAGQLVIDSNPADCEVFTIDKDTGKKNAVGRTPYKSDMDLIKTNVGNNGVLQVEVHKPGFEPYNIAIPIVGNNDIKINANLEVEKDIKLTQDFDLLVSDLFDVLRMIRLKDYGNGLKKLEMLEKKFPHYSIVYEMKGTILYLQKNFKQALNFYRKAFGINPKNREAYKMKVYLEKKFKIGS